jgi:hypothetical protein
MAEKARRNQHGRCWRGRWLQRQRVLLGLRQGAGGAARYWECCVAAAGGRCDGEMCSSCSSPSTGEEVSDSRAQKTWFPCFPCPLPFCSLFWGAWLSSRSREI